MLRRTAARMLSTAPKVYSKSPLPVDVEAGKAYFYCTCGYSTNQPFCDGTHRGVNETRDAKFTPMKVTIDEAKTAYFCGCRRSANQPFCDGTHTSLNTAPKVYSRSPLPVDVEAGKDYFYCTCGYSTNQPFCDGTHRGVNEAKGTQFAPTKVTPDEAKTAYFCGCRRSAGQPFCDGSHNAITEVVGRDPVAVSFKDYEVVSHKEYNHDTVLVTLKHKDGKGVPLDASYHFSLKLGGKTRPYTPVEYNAATGEVTFLIKVMPNGFVSTQVRDLKVGDSVELKGPSPGEYYCEGKHSVVVLLGGGSGLTPLLQVMQDAVREQRKIELYLLYSNKTAQDILWEDELKRMQDAHPGILKVVNHFVTDVQGENSGDVKYELCTAQAIKGAIPPVGPGHHALLCGTPGFNKAMQDACTELGFKPNQITLA